MPWHISTSRQIERWQVGPGRNPGLSEWHPGPSRQVIPWPPCVCGIGPKRLCWF